MKLIDRRKFLNTTRIYKDDPSDVVFRKYAVRRLIKAQPVVNAIPIPEGATNGDVIKAMFSDSTKYEFGIEDNLKIATMFVISETSQAFYVHFDLDWWNAPYEKSEG